MVQVTENLALASMVVSSPRLLPKPDNDFSLVGSFNPAKVDRLSDAPGAPDDDAGYLVGVIPFKAEWVRDTFSVTSAVARAGVITSIVGYMRASPEVATIARGVATLDGVTVTGPEVDLPLEGAYQDVELELPHPAGGAWTYEELERAALGYDFRQQSFTSMNKITQFYMIVKAETAAGAAQSVKLRISALAARLN